MMYGRVYNVNRSNMYDNSMKAWRWENEVSYCKGFIRYVKWYIITWKLTVIDIYYKP